ncbi:SDR family NAD(P)-dependent oxidoreductase [Mycobacterium sp.]|uniref:SDR family NAD(P)-dependent oxidoreductase n=1 Tax=Mycobacterium sp. TaxID=1785 RepID=UPI0025F9A3D0|nr:SDR family NAD(P)-dependent oxidoreductase [Mycobacterium sp.]
MSHARTVVITEASSPVARATATRLAVAGHLVLMGSRRPQVCEEAAARLRSQGMSVFAAHLDLADPFSIDRFLQSADYLVGEADVLISTAGVADRSWAGAQHLVMQLIPPMIDGGRGDVVLVSPALDGVAPAGADRMLEAWVHGLDAEFVGTGVRMSIVRSTEAVPADDAGRLIAAAIGSPDMHLRVVDVIPPYRESATVDGATREMRR